MEEKQSLLYYINADIAVKISLKQQNKLYIMVLFQLAPRNSQNEIKLTL